MLSSLSIPDSAARDRHLDSLFRGNYGWLLGRIRYRMRGMGDYEDIAAESFAQCFALPNVMDLRDPRAMLVTLAKRLMWRSKRKRDLHEAYIAALAATPLETSTSIDAQQDALSTLTAIDQALDGMSAKARAAFVYCFVDDLTYDQAAAKLGVSASMVRKYLAKALIACDAIYQAEQANV